MRITTLYRISDGGYDKVKLEHASKLHCLRNFLSVFGSTDIVVFADRCTPATLDGVKSLGVWCVETSAGSSAGSWRRVATFARKNLSATDYVYFLEDDYLHLPGAAEVLREGLQIADYVTLYDHPDKYIDLSRGGNPVGREQGELTRVLLTASTHWKLTNSTTMTFACRLSTLSSDWPIWWWFTLGRHPHDFKSFRLLTRGRPFGRRRRLISPLPGLSTHIEKAWLSPRTDWTRI